MRRGALLSIVLAACGSRTGLDVARGAAGDGGGGGGGSTPVDAGGPAPFTPTCDWVSSGPTGRVSDDPNPIGDVALLDAVTMRGAGGLVAWLTPGTLSDVQTIRSLLTPFRPGAEPHNPQVDFVAEDVTTTFQGAWITPGHGKGSRATVAMAALEQNKCKVHPITLDGASNGGTALATIERCALLSGREDTTSPLELVVWSEATSPTAVHTLFLDGEGQPNAPGAKLFSGKGREHVVVPARVRFDDGSSLAAIAWNAGDTNVRIAARHFAADGTPLAEEATLFSATTGASGAAMALASTSTGAMAGWIDTSTATGKISLAPLDRDAQPLPTVATAAKGTAGAVVTALADATNVTTFALADDTRGGALLGWVTYDATTLRGRVHVQSFGPDGLALADPIDVTSGFAGGVAPSLRIVTDDGFAQVYFGAARTRDDAHMIYLAPLTCVPR